jgi:hypothetical protein
MHSSRALTTASGVKHESVNTFPLASERSRSRLFRQRESETSTRSNLPALFVPAQKSAIFRGGQFTMLRHNITQPFRKGNTVFLISLPQSFTQQYYPLGVSIYNFISYGRAKIHHKRWPRTLRRPRSAVTLPLQKQLLRFPYMALNTHNAQASVFFKWHKHSSRGWL